jgi:GTPase SAR1 family protein
LASGQCHQFNEESRFQAAYSDAVCGSGKPFLYSRICLVGQGRGGKTALVNALCGLAFDSKIAVELKEMRVQAHRSGRWNVVQDKPDRTEAFAEDQLAWAIAHQLSGQPESGDGCITDCLGISEPHISASPADVAAAISASIPCTPTVLFAQKPSSAVFPPALLHTMPQMLNIVTPHDRTQAVPQLVSTFSITDGNSVAPAPVVRVDKELVLQRMREEEPIRIALMDFGGQKSFHSLHPLYLTRNSVYLLVFNMQWLSRPASAEKGGQDSTNQRDSCLSYISFWLNSIFVHTKAAGYGSARVLLVGTHRDSVCSPVEHEAISRLIYDQFKAMPAFYAVIPFKQGMTTSDRGGLWFHPVDNTKSGTDESIDSLKAAIKDCLEKEYHLKCKVPLPWLLAFDQLQATKQPYLTLDQVQCIAKKCGLPVTKRSLADEVACWLKYFTDLGLILHQNRPSLSHLVVVDTRRCLVDPAAAVVCQHEIHMLDVQERACRAQSEAYRLLMTEGVLSKSLLEVLWDSCANMKEEVAKFMVNYGVLIPLLEKSHSPTNQFLVPSLLPDRGGADEQSAVMAHCYFLFGTQSAEWEKVGNVASSAVSSYGFCPAGLFSRLTGKIVSECQCTYNYFGSRCSSSQTSACFGRHMFVVRELVGLNMIQLLVMVHNPRKLVREISHLVQLVIDEMTPNLGFVVAVFEDGGSNQNFQRSSVQSAHFVVLNHVIKSVNGGDIVHVNSSTNSRLSASEAGTLFQRWVPTAGLCETYDVFLSYRWTGSFDEDLTLGLFNNISEDVLGSSGREINVFLDKRRLQDGRNFQDDFADALLNTALPVVIMSTAALQRMVNINADSAIDNLLLEWTLIAELLQSKTIFNCLPIIIGTFNPSACSCAAVFSDFFNDSVAAADGSILYSGIDSLPDISVASIIHKVRDLLRQRNLSESPALNSHTVRSVVKYLSLHQAVLVSKLLQEPALQQVHASHFKDEVTRTVVEHCGGKIRSMLEFLEVQKSQSYPSVGYRAVVLDGLAQRLRRLSVSDDDAVLSDMSAKLRKDGVVSFECLLKLSKDELEEQMASLNLKPAQRRKLFDAILKQPSA